MKTTSPHSSDITAHSALCLSLGLVFALLGATAAQGANYTLGATNCWEGPASGTDSVVLAVNPANGVWSATANAAWLHLSAANQNGTGSTNVVFTFDANTGATRSGTLTIGGQTLTVTQAGSTYVRAPGPLSTLVSSGIYQPHAVAVDGAGNVYIADAGNNAIKKWVAASNIVTTLVSSGLNQPYGVAVDGAGNVYIADTYNNAIKEWVAASGTVTNLVSSGLNQPYGVAVDGAGNVYIADTYNNAIKEWVVASNTVITNVSSGLSFPYSVAVDGAGNVYIADIGHTAIKEWVAASGTVITLVSSGLSAPWNVAVDGAGNVYIADYYNNAVKEWVAASSTVITLASSGLNGPLGVAVDGAGNIYISDYGYNQIKELPRAFVDPTARWERPAAGSDSLPVVLPATENLLAPFAPTSDQSWLTIAGVTNGVVSYAFTGNTANSNRTAHVTLLGQSIPITQFSFANYASLGATNLLEGPGAGSDSVVLAVNMPNGPWTATANDIWLHLSAENQSGTGSTNVVFTFDVNPGATRSGTLTIAGQTLTVTQAGSTYVAAPAPVTALVSSGLNMAWGVAVDGVGNVYITDTYNNAIKKWVAASNTVITLVSSGLNVPTGVAVDGAGNVYIADLLNNAIKKWVAASNTVVTLVSSGLNQPYDVAVDGAGNVYIADYLNNAIKKWVAASNTVVTLVSSGLSGPWGVAVDGAGNVYIADTWNNQVKEWVAASHTVITLVSSGLNQPASVAVDGSGNVYIADLSHSAIKEWVAASHTVITNVASGLNQPSGVAVDSAGNVYIADLYNYAIKELPRAFVDPTARSEGAASGADSLPVVLPPTENLRDPFAPTSDQPWLTVTSVTNGVVGFSFTGTTSNRTAHITLLGQAIAINQAGLPAPPILISPVVLANGSFQFAFSNTVSGASFTILSTTNLDLPVVDWQVLATSNNCAAGLLQFTIPLTTSDAQRFYDLRSP
jgi:DNA-binding beta-propeller fold protein YncE